MKPQNSDQLENSTIQTRFVLFLFFLWRFLFERLISWTTTFVVLHNFYDSSHNDSSHRVHLRRFSWGLRKVLRNILRSAKILFFRYRIKKKSISAFIFFFCNKKNPENWIHNFFLFYFIFFHVTYTELNSDFFYSSILFVSCQFYFLRPWHWRS